MEDKEILEELKQIREELHNIKLWMILLFLIAIALFWFTFLTF